MLSLLQPALHRTTVSGEVVWDEDGAPVDAAVVLVQGAFSGGVNASAAVLSDEQRRFEASKLVCPPRP